MMQTTDDGRDEFERNANQIEEFLWLGNEEAGQAPLEILKKHHITHICVPANITRDRMPHLYSEIKYLHLYVADVVDFPIIQLWPECIEFINQGTSSGGTVLVHCAQGKSRSASVVLAYLMQKHNWTFREAHHYVNQRRPISTKFEQQLQLWYDMGYDLEGSTPAHAKCRADYKRSPFNKKKD